MLFWLVKFLWNIFPGWLFVPPSELGMEKEEITRFSFWDRQYIGNKIQLNSLNPQRGSVHFTNKNTSTLYWLTELGQKFSLLSDHPSSCSYCSSLCISPYILPSSPLQTQWAYKYANILINYIFKDFVSK